MRAVDAERPVVQGAQCARAVVMVRPAQFYANPETLSTNAFQHVVDASAAQMLAAARAEFDGAVEALTQAGVRVAVLEADPERDTPDALFPNNWFSTHADGRLVLYPMSTANRRAERRPADLGRLAAVEHWQITDTLDLTSLEQRGLIVEGTGSLVLDRDARLAYAALSPRTHAEAVEIVCRALGFEAVPFHAHDSAGREIYHTNVLMSVGPSLAVLASELVQPGADLRRVFDALEQTGKTLLDLSAAQVSEFAGNVLFLESSSGTPLVALSRRAWKSLTRAQRQLLESHAQPVSCAVETIEHVGGGGIRCMLAEIFLPPAGITGALAPR